MIEEFQAVLVQSLMPMDMETVEVQEFVVLWLIVVVETQEKIISPLLIT
jgi:hypothetical protein